MVKEFKNYTIKIYQSKDDSKFKEAWNSDIAFKIKAMDHKRSSGVIRSGERQTCRPKIKYGSTGSLVFLDDKNKSRCIKSIVATGTIARTLERSLLFFATQKEYDPKHFVFHLVKDNFTYADHYVIRHVYNRKFNGWFVIKGNTLYANFFGNDVSSYDGTFDFKCQRRVGSDAKKCTFYAYCIPTEDGIFYSLRNTPKCDH